MKKTLAALAPLLLASIPHAMAATYFASPSGDNANAGTRQSPWRTLGFSASKLRAGDTLYAMGGTYAETVWVGNSGTSAAPISIRAYPGQSPVIDGSSLHVGDWASLLSLAGDHIAVSGFAIRNINSDGHGGGGPAAVEGGYGVSIEGSQDTVSNLTVSYTWAQGIFASGDGSVIEDSEIHHVAMSNCRKAGDANCSAAPRGWPSCVSAASNYNSGKITRTPIIQRNKVHDCWGEGISTWLSDGAVLQDNIAYDNWAQNLYVNNATNALVQRNIVYNSQGNYVGARGGFSLADEVANDNPALNLRSANNTVVDNLVLNAPFSAFSWTLVKGTGLNGCLIANNTFVNSEPYSNMASFGTGGSASDGVANSNSMVYNNIVVGSVSAPSDAGLSFSNNLWAISPPAAARGPGDVIGDPLLAGAGYAAPGALAASYFELRRNSPAIGKGKPLRQVPTDFDEVASAAAPNIGAMGQEGSKAPSGPSSPRGAPIPPPLPPSFGPRAGDQPASR